MFLRSHLFFWLYLTVLSVASGQEVVYPGDANNNGHVDHYDVLSIGYAFGSSGPTRLDTSALAAQDILIYWSDNFPNGLNYTHADANNNGQVDFLDFFTLSLNNGISFTEVDELLFSEQLPGNAATVELEQENPFEAALISGQQLQIPVKVSDLATGTLINGVAMNLVYDPTFFTVFDFTFSDEWINADNGSFTIINESPGLIHLGITRFGVDPVAGNGTIGTLNLTIIEDLVGLLPNVQDTLFDFVNVVDIQLYDQDFELVPTDIASVDLINSLPLATESVENNPDLLQLTISPNPSNGLFNISSRLPFERIELISPLGITTLLYDGISQLKHSLNLSNYSTGKYYLRSSGARGQSIVPIVLRQ